MEAMEVFEARMEASVGFGLGVLVGLGRGFVDYQRRGEYLSTSARTCARARPARCSPLLYSDSAW